MKNPMETPEYERAVREAKEREEKPDTATVTKALDRSMTAKLVYGAIVALVSASLTFGLSQYSQGHATAQEIQRQKIKLEAFEAMSVVESKAMRERIEFEAISRREQDLIINLRIDKQASSLDRLIDQNSQLIALIRAQNQMLNSKP